MDAGCGAMPLSTIQHLSETASPEHKLQPPHSPHKQNHHGKYEENGGVSQVSSVMLYGVPIVSLVIDRQERLCLAQISNTLLKEFSYNEIHNRRVALGITCVQCTPVQLEILRRAGAMPISSRRCGMITKREAERLCKSFLGDNTPPKLPEHFAFEVYHECAWGCRGSFVPSRYNSSRAKCIKCTFCNLFFSPNKFIFHSHRLPDSKYVQPDAANFNSWRRHMKLSGTPHDDVIHAWEDVKAMFNGGTRKRMLSSSSSPSSSKSRNSNSESRPTYTSAPTKVKSSPLSLPAPPPPPPPPPRPELSPYSQPMPQVPTTPLSPRVPPLPTYPTPDKAPHPYDLHRSFVDYVWNHQATVPTSPAQHKPFHFAPYSLPWLKRPLLAFGPAAVAAAAAVAGENLPEPPPLTPMPLSVPVTSGSAVVAAAAAAALSHHLYSSAFRPVGQLKLSSTEATESAAHSEDEEEETVDIETTEDDVPTNWEHPPRPHSASPHCSVSPHSDTQERQCTPPEDVSRSVCSPEPPRRPSPSERSWRLALPEKSRHQQHYRPEFVARQLHLMRELASSPESTPTALLRDLQNSERRVRITPSVPARMKETLVSGKMVIDCSGCHAMQDSP